MAQTVTFFSKYTGHQLVRQPAVDKPLPAGTGWIRETDGVRYQFLPALDDESGQLVGRLDVKAGQDKLQDTRGWLRPDADVEKVRDAVEALRDHREFGQGRDFWEASTPAKLVRASIRRALANLDEDALTAVLETEKAQNNRAEIVSEADDALALVREQIASLQARAEQEQADAEAAKPKAKAKPKAPPA